MNNVKLSISECIMQFEKLHNYYIFSFRISLYIFTMARGHREKLGGEQKTVGLYHWKFASKGMKKGWMASWMDAYVTHNIDPQTFQFWMDFKLKIQS